MAVLSAVESAVTHTSPLSNSVSVFLFTMANKYVCNEIDISELINLMKVYSDPKRKFSAIVPLDSDIMLEYIGQADKENIVENLEKVQNIFGVNRRNFEQYAKESSIEFEKYKRHLNESSCYYGEEFKGRNSMLTNDNRHTLELQISNETGKIMAAILSLVITIFYLLMDISAQLLDI